MVARRCRAGVSAPRLRRESSAANRAPMRSRSKVRVGREVPMATTGTSTMSTTTTATAWMAHTRAAAKRVGRRSAVGASFSGAACIGGMLQSVQMYRAPSWSCGQRNGDVTNAARPGSVGTRLGRDRVWLYDCSVRETVRTQSRGSAARRAYCPAMAARGTEDQRSVTPTAMGTQRIALRFPMP